LEKCNGKGFLYRVKTGTSMILCLFHDALIQT
jgi:hypothetical protein